MVTYNRNSACEGLSPYQLKMAAPAEVSKKRSNFRIRQFYEKRHFNIAANLTLNTMVSFINPRRACAARVAVVVLCVCMCVCMCVCPLIPAASHIGIAKERYQRILRNTGIVLKKEFFFKTLRSEVMALFTHL